MTNETQICSCGSHMRMLPDMFGKVTPICRNTDCVCNLYFPPSREDWAIAGSIMGHRSYGHSPKVGDLLTWETKFPDSTPGNTVRGEAEVEASHLKLADWMSTASLDEIECAQIDMEEHEARAARCLPA